MSRLGLYLLGPPQVELDGEPVHIGRRKALALLAYLVVTRERHRRDTLATLLWPENPQSSARAELRRNLSLLNRTLGQECLTADRETAGLDPGADVWLDVAQFRQHLVACETHDHSAAEVCAKCVSSLEGAVSLYRDDFLAGFTLRDSPAFDEWQFFQTQGLRDELASALERLAACHSAEGEFEAAIPYARRWLELDPTHESAHRQLMALYAQAGRRAAALRQYRECVRVLEQELGLPPAAETTALYEQLRAPGVSAMGAEVAAPTLTLPSTPSPAFLREDVQPAMVERPAFVARERELAQLSRHLDAALAGQGRVVFITGGPGRGKTTLMAEFARRAMEARPDLLVASGACNAYSGVGDPYLPFRETLGMLTGDVEALWAAGIVSSAHARRLWSSVPLSSRALLDHGPFLIDALVPGPALLSRATTCARASDDDDWLEQLRAWVERKRGERSDLEQSALFTQLTNVLTTLSAAHPLLLLLDDLQWADGGSIGLLFHLGRRLNSARILIVGAYRPEEVAIARDGAPHPLQELLSEFQRLFGEVTLDLSQVDDDEGRRFVDDWLDAEPNRLSADFRATLHRHSGGHPLFTVELLRSMQERGDLIQDDEGLWVESQALDWATLPARVEAVVEKRVERLDQELRDLLAVASVEGERFTAQVVAQVEGVSERDVLRAMSRELGPAGHRLVWEAEETRIAGTGRVLSRFRFAHALFQEYLHQALSAGELRLLHGEVAEALEGLYGEQTDEIVAQLAHHYAEAGQREKAIEYALRAGEQARLAHANDEAIAYFRRALAFLGESALSESRKDWRLEALRGLGQLYFIMGQVVEAEKCFREAITLGREMGLAPHKMVRLYYWMGDALFWQSRYDDMIRIGEEGLALLEDDAGSGEAVESVEAVLMNQHIAAGHVRMGNRERVRELTHRTAQFIQRLPYVEELRPAYNHIIESRFRYDRDAEGALRWVQVLEEKATSQHDLRGLGEAQELAGMVLFLMGDLRGAILRYRQALELYSRVGDAKVQSWALWHLGWAFFRLGDLDKADQYADKALEPARAVGDKFVIASRYVGIGEVALCQGDLEKAVGAFQNAIRLFREIVEGRFEVQATHSLGQTYLAQGDRGEALKRFQEAITLAGSGMRYVFWYEPVASSYMLSGLEAAYDDPAAFRAFCRRTQEEHPKASEWPLVQWYLEPAESRRDFGLPTLDFGFNAHDFRNQEWVWEDPFGDCSNEVQNGLEILAANGRGLWHINLSAPRLLRPAPDDDFAVQTLCVPTAVDRPSIGGLLLWQDEDNYLRLDRGTRGPREISFQGCIGNKDVVIGRGRLGVGDSGFGDSGTRSLNDAEFWLRLEKMDDRVRALCSADGEDWFSVGQIDFPTEGPLQVGLHAIGMIDRTVYHGAYPDGTAIRFESFQMWGS